MIMSWQVTRSCTKINGRGWLLLKKREKSSVDGITWDGVIIENVPCCGGVMNVHSSWEYNSTLKREDDTEEKRI